ncbi:MAG: 2-hydroxychromene-2-carboxylate isomerase [Hyphomicrobiaceae bacterium]
MPEPIEFYFDFISPYAYLGSIGIERIAERHGRAVDWRPMLLGISVLKVMGLKPVPDTPLKGPYSDHDAARFARYLGIPYSAAAETQFAPLPSARAFTWIKDRDAALATRFAQRIFAAHWGEGRDMGTAEAVAGEAEALGVPRAELLAAIETDAVKQRLRAHVDASIAKGVFGAPTFIVDGEMFWGADRLDQVERWIETGGW